MRAIWPVEDKAKLVSDLVEADAATRDERADRLAFLLREFGPPADMLLVGGMGAMFAISELQNSFLNGNFMGTILLCQVFVEHSLAGSYALGGDDNLMLDGFKVLIDRSLADGRISAPLAARLQDLREMRNPYNHPRPFSKPNNLLQRIVTRKTDPHEMASEDAQTAISIVVDFIREGCPSWIPANHPPTNDA
jgi:hypothetical protein